MEFLANNEQINRAKQIYNWLNKVKLHKIIFNDENENRPITIIYITPSNKLEKYIPYIDENNIEKINYIIG